MPQAVRFSNGTVISDAEARIREYCEVEVYSDRNYIGGYDDRTDVTDRVRMENLDAANNLNADLDGLDRGRILHNKDIPVILAQIEDVDLGELSDDEWGRVRPELSSILSVFLSIQNVELASAFKVLHLKRPRLLPVVDSHVVKFLTGNDVEGNAFTREELLQIGLRALDVARADLVKNRDAFAELGRSLADLPTPLTPVRMYDILCWTQEKWVNKGDTTSPYGTPGRLLGGPSRTERSESEGSPPPAAASEEPPSGEIATIKAFRQVKLHAEGVVVSTGSSPPRVHRPLCTELTEERFQNAVVFNEGKGGRYYLRKDLAEAVREFGGVACKKCRPERPVRPASA